MCVDPYEPHTNGGFVREEGYRVADDALLYFKSAVRGQNLLRFLFHADDYQAGFAEDRLLDRCFQFFTSENLKLFFATTRLNFMFAVSIILIVLNL